MRIHTAVACMGLVRLSLAAKKCYFPNGLEATSDTPCDPDAEDSMCCFKGSPHGRACLSNKMCLSPEGKVIRGSCTDRDWKSPECSDQCWDVQGGGANLISCSNVTNKDTSYCCERTEKANCCDSGIGRFELLPPQPITLAVWDSSEGVYTRFAQLSSSTSATTTTSTTPGSEQTTSTTASGNGARETGSNEPSRDTTTGGSEQETASTSSGGLSPAAQAGIGVGAAAIVILLAVIAFLLWKLNKSKAALAAAAATPPMAPPQQPPTSYVQEWYKQQQQQQHAYELRSGREWDQYQGTTPVSAELYEHERTELPAGINASRYA